jgi:pimeloyl-ACP methyl ester carboxylesterase
METQKIKGQAKSIILDNGAEITYCEKGEENKEVLIMGGFFFITFMPMVEHLAKHYHVYGVVMRFSGPTDQLAADGHTHWGRQWGKDIYDFAIKMGIQKFHYFGKCHGSVPGWYLFRNHPEMLEDFSCFFLAPHLKGQNSNKWFELQSDLKAMMASAIRNVETGLPKKMEEANVFSEADKANFWAINTYAASPEKIWDSIEECEKNLKTTHIPVGFLFGSDDPLFYDFYDSNMYIWQIVKGCHFTIVHGEKHLMEIDCPDRVADEVLSFINQAHKNYN